MSENLENAKELTVLILVFVDTRGEFLLGLNMGLIGVVLILVFVDTRGEPYLWALNMASIGGLNPSFRGYARRVYFER